MTCGVQTQKATFTTSATSSTSAAGLCSRVTYTNCRMMGRKLQKLPTHLDGSPFSEVWIWPVLLRKLLLSIHHAGCTSFNEPATVPIVPFSIAKPKNKTARQWFPAAQQIHANGTKTLAAKSPQFGSLPPASRRSLGGG